MALNILAQTDISKLPQLGADHVHLVSEAFTLAMAERDRFIADPAFKALPVEQMLSDEFARTQYARIDMNKALTQPVESALPNHRDTVYLSVVDKDRNVCSFINSVFYSWGCGLVAGSTGINLQNRGSGFSLEDGHFNQIEPNKRPMHTIIPAMVYRQGKPVLSFGVMGGQYQAMGQAYVLSNWIDYGMDIQEALDAARFFLYAGVLEVEANVPATARTGLAEKGHNVVASDSSWGGGQAIVIDWDNGVLQGGSDPRKDGHAAGY
jgi:gamma-glutamyltranspeptidase/glutathione hydrolase